MMLYDLVKRPNSSANKVGKRTKAKIDEFCENAKTVTIDNVVELDFAVELMRKAKALGEVVMDLTEPFRASSYAHYQEVQKEQKGLVEPLEEAVRHLRDRIADFRKRASAELLAASIRLETEPSDASLASFNDLADQVKDIDTANLEYREYFRAVVTDRDAFLQWAMEVGRDDLIEINMKALNKMASRMGEAFTLPGCAVTKKVTPVLKKENG